MPKDNIHDPKFKFPGKLLGKHVWKFPIHKKLKSIKSKGQDSYMIWEIYVGVCPVDTDKNIIAETLNGRINNESEISQVFSSVCSEIKPSYFNHLQINKADNSIRLKGFTVVNSRHEGSPDKFGVMTFVKQGKNLRKSNRTNIFTQSMSDALSKYEKRTNKGKYYEPMLATGEAIVAEDEDRVLKELFDKHKGNFVLQKKYDGIRLLVEYIVATKEINSYSRGAKDMIISDAIINDCKLIFETLIANHPNFEKLDKIILDGEQYIHGVKLQKISGLGRRESEHDEQRDQLEYYIYDIILLINEYPTNNTYEERAKIRKEIEPLKLNKTYYVNDFIMESLTQLKKLYHKVLDDGYEGLIMRFLDKPYKSGRGKNMLKIKPSYREEFPIVGFKTGRGKDEGKPIYICEITMQTAKSAIEFIRKRVRTFSVDVDEIFEGDIKFSCKPTGDDETNRALYEKYIQIQDDGFTWFYHNVEGKMATVEFQDYSEKLIPNRAVLIEIHDD